MQNPYLIEGPVARFCTAELKVRTIERWAAANEVVDFYNVIGLRADEPRRVANIRGKPELKGCIERIAPMYDAGEGVQKVSDFWNRQDFDLRLENVNGSTPYGNCDLCFLKNGPKIFGIIRDRPDLAEWWIEAERTVPHINKPRGFMTFRTDRPSYEQMLDFSQRQGDLFADAPDEDTIPCMCTD
jgi:3'-phosphoadenosine 5'-phosphosulfate sulfotransferase (PAPS reductase)/FAD synthetase|tara:strand:+ start:466 stop:1020 length:555 start_codon:yes stop_codon:yes gene_type:complete